MPKVIGYVRVSTQEQAEQGVSLDAQKSKIKTYCDLHNLNLIEILADEGVSAKNLNRPQAQTVIAMIQSKKIDGVVIFKLDRLVRNTADALHIADLCKTRGVALHSISEKLDTKSAFGEFFFTLMAALGQLERKQIGERTSVALKHKKSIGEKTGGRIPFGYDVVEENTVDGPLKKLVENPVEQETIQQIMEFHKAGKSIREICAWLKRKKVRTKYGKSNWNPRTVWHILRKNTQKTVAERPNSNR